MQGERRDPVAQRPEFLNIFRHMEIDDRADMQQPGGGVAVEGAAESERLHQGLESRHVVRQFFRRHGDYAATQHQSGLPDFLRTVAERIDLTHSGDCDPFWLCMDCPHRRFYSGDGCMQLGQRLCFIQQPGASAAHELSGAGSNCCINLLTGTRINLPRCNQ